MIAPNRYTVIRQLAMAASEERLGLFVGTGFSIAATKGTAPSFLQLLERVASALGLPSNLSAYPFLQKSLPQIASQLVVELVNTGMPRDKAVASLKECIADLCNLTPAESEYDRFSRSLNRVGPSWIITTNYDLILESLMEDARSVLPSQPLFPSAKLVPVFHLHGHRYTPNSIRVTEEDYVSLIAPLDYQRLKLPLLFHESTTLLLGYALGDMNVRAAMEWSRSFREPNDKSINVVQAFYTKSPSKDPRIGPSGETIVEIDDIPALLDEITEESMELSMYEDYSAHIIHDFLQTADASEIAKPGATREEFLEIIEKSVGVASAQALSKLLKKATDPIWKNAKEDGGFVFYGVYLSVFLQVLKKLEFREANPNFIAFLSYSLDRVGEYFSETNAFGYAWEASKAWMQEAPTLNHALVRELHSFANTNNLAGLSKLTGCSALKSILSR